MDADQVDPDTQIDIMDMYRQGYKGSNHAGSNYTATRLNTRTSWPNRWAGSPQVFGATLIGVVQLAEFQREGEARNSWAGTGPQARRHVLGDSNDSEWFQGHGGWYAAKVANCSLAVRPGSEAPFQYTVTDIDTGRSIYTGTAGSLDEAKDAAESAARNKFDSATMDNY